MSELAIAPGRDLRLIQRKKRAKPNWGLPGLNRSKKKGTAGDNPQEFLNSNHLISQGMRQTNQVEHIQVRQDDDGDYWIVITAEAGSVGISLSSNHQLNPNRIKLEAWAEDQLRRVEPGKEPSAQCRNREDRN